MTFRDRKTFVKLNFFLDSQEEDIITVDDQPRKRPAEDAPKSDQPGHKWPKPGEVNKI